MSARTALGRYATTYGGDYWERQRASELRLQEQARRHAIVRLHAPGVTDPGQGGRVRALCEEWGVACPPFPNLPPLPEVAPGVYANTTDPAFLAVLEAL